MDSLKKRVQQGNVRFYIDFLYLSFDPSKINPDGGAHANYLIYDKKYKQMFRFEPHGYKTSIYDNDLLDKFLIKKFKTSKIDYKPIRESCPRLGPQSYDSPGYNAYELKGFCYFWSTFFIDYLLSNYKKSKYKNKTIRDIQEDMIKNIKDVSGRFKPFIRSYAVFINNIARNITNKNIEEYIEKMRKLLG